MRRLLNFFLSMLVLVSAASFVQSQETARPSAQGKIVKWESLSGKNNEIMFSFPQGYETLADGNYYLGKNGTKKVDKKLTVSRYINGVVLITEYYEGDARGIRESLQENEKVSAGTTRQSNGFEIGEFAGNFENYYYKTQYFYNKNRLYVVKAVTKSENNKILQDYFSAVRLFADGKAVLPNAGKDVTELLISNIVEAAVSPTVDDTVIDSKDADRKVILLNLPKPKFPRDAFGNRREGETKLKVLFSASGKVTNVEVLKSPSKEIGLAAAEAIKTAKFLPAEKDGKPVSVYQMESYSFSTSTSIRIL